MSKHTSQPWHVGMKPGPIIYGPNGEQVADMSARLLDDGETLANIRLVKAAPDMLELLEESLNYIYASMGMDDPNPDITDRIDNLIRKVKGEL